MHTLYKEKKLLHRDISIGNLAFEEIDGKLVIIILDFELASYATSDEHRNEVRTGTAPYMAREVLEGFKLMYIHTLRHDLESVYYVFVHVAAGYYRKRNSKPPGRDPLYKWRKGNYESMRDAKHEHLCAMVSPFLSDGDCEAEIPIEDADIATILERIRRQYAARALKLAKVDVMRSELIEQTCAVIEQRAEAEGKSRAEAVRLGDEKME